MWIKTTRSKLFMRFSLLLLSMAGMFSLLFAMFGPTILVAQAASSGNWSTYLGSLGRTGYDKTETILNPSSVKNLHGHWHLTTGGPISAQPVIDNGRVFFGSWDGNEYATDLNGNKLWSQYLGQTTVKNCEDGTTGVASTATVADIAISGKTQEVVFVGGGNADFYALNAKNGNILWHTSLGPSPATFIWASPAYYNGSIYIGVASFGDCPLVQGQLVQLNAATGTVQNTFNTAPNGCTGNGVWGSPTIDSSTGDMYIVTGNGGSCSQKEPYAISILEFNTANFSLVGYWPVPASQLGFDQDFGSTPTLFKATIKGNVTNMVGVVNKNGTYYAFNRNNISAGPVWQVSIGVGGDCPLCGTAQIAPAAWNGTNLYVASENTTINGTSCLGSIRQLDPATGKFLWQDCLNDGPVLAAVSAIPGVIFVAAGGDLLAVNAVNGNILKTLTDSKSGSLYFGPASIANGVVYIGNVDDILHVYGV